MHTAAGHWHSRSAPRPGAWIFFRRAH
ncbi:MAG TPA: hypothetical protein DCE36_19450 [Pseudomonas sp.]|nr:hypothetical protein FIV40_10975 [Pseudomonas marginalis]HAA42254.1 hypothetical protein [Pseudomonas sp.]